MSEIISDTLRELSPSGGSRYSIVSVLKDELRKRADEGKASPEKK